MEGLQGPYKRSVQSPRTEGSPVPRPSGPGALLFASDSVSTWFSPLLSESIYFVWL